jgi:hypothetical protein
LIASRGLEEPRRDAAERLRVRASMGLLLEENVLCNAARGLGALGGLRRGRALCCLVRPHARQEVAHVLLLDRVLERRAVALERDPPRQELGPR